MATLRQIAEHNALRRRKRSQDARDYATLIATPASLGNVAAGASSSTVTLPANARLGVSLDAITVAQDLAADDGVNIVYGSGGVADLVQRLDVVGESRAVKIKRSLVCPAGTATLYILDEWNLPFAIATATFT